MNTIYLFSYRLIVVPFSLFLFLFLSIFLEKFRVGLRLRLSKEYRPPYPPQSKDSQPIWFHCSSGEFEYAKPVIQEIKKRAPQQKILVTFYSPSFIESIKKDPYVDFCYPLPWETSSAVSSFLRHFRPKKILFARTDLWPELLTQAQKKGIPTCLFSRTQKEISLNFLKKGLLPWLFGQLEIIFFASKIDLNNHQTAFSNSTQTQLVVSGDTKYDRVIHREQSSVPKKPLEPNKFCLVLGSVWPNDWKEVFPPAYALFQQGKINLIVAPHEYNENFKAFIQKYENDLEYYSKTEHWNPNKILIVDVFGVLFDTYRAADLSFVGGSFKKNVHSVMEPLACGSPVVVGPYNQNNREAQDFKLKFLGRNFPMVKEVEKGEDVLKVFRQLSSLDLPKKEIQQQIIHEVKMKAGASKAVADWILTPSESFRG